MIWAKKLLFRITLKKSSSKCKLGHSLRYKARKVFVVSLTSKWLCNLNFFLLNLTIIIENINVTKLTNFHGKKGSDFTNENYFHYAGSMPFDANCYH